ncbi:MAG: alpha/beta hydrolase-fold protein [Jatrophihabitans sp.]
MVPISGESDATGVSFHLADRQRRLAGVRLRHELGPEPVDFDRLPGGWTLRLDQPAVDRMEYLFELQDHHDHHWTITDPANPLRAPGAFGEKSVVEFASYVRPEWLAAAPPVGTLGEAEFDVLDSTMTVGLWTPCGLDGPAPLLVVHDGPEFDALGGFTHWLGASIAAGLIPPTRAALLDPGDRNVWYAANPDYADALCEQVLLNLPPATATIGIGASLGALAVLHAHRRHPGCFDALFLQSGSFFTAENDPQEAGFSGFATVTDFVDSVHAATREDAPVPAVLTCGTVEENLANNQAMAATLGRLGSDVALHERRDAHNFTAWRDALHPYLTELVARAS